MTIFVSYNKSKKTFRAFHVEAHNIVFQAKNEKALVKAMRTTLKTKHPTLKLEANPKLEQLDWNTFHSVYEKVNIPQDSWEMKEFDPKDVI